MIVEFEDKAIEELFEIGKTSDRRYKKLCKDVKFLDALVTVIKTLYSVDCTQDLYNISRLDYEKLKYDYSGFSSVRIIKNRVERLIFTEHENGIRIKLIEINQEHYGKRK